MLGRDFGKVHAKAAKLRESGGSPAALAFLKENLGETVEKVDARQADNYAKCHLLLAECQAECGVRGNSPRQALEGIQALLKLPGSHPGLLQGGSSAWPDLLATVEKLLRAVLDPQWVPNGNKSAFVTEIAAVAAAWNQLGKPQFAQRACQMGLRVFGGDAGLLLLQAEAEASLRNFSASLECLKAVIRSGAAPQSPGKMITLLEMAQGTSEASVSGLAWALTGEVYYRLGRWEQAFASAQRASETLGDGLEDFSVQALLLAASRNRKLDEFEQHSQRFLKRGLSADLLASLADETRQLLAQYPHRKRLWLTWGAVALRTGQNEDAVMAFKQSLVIDRALAAEVVAWYRAAGAYSTADASLCVNLAQVLFRAGQPDDALSVLARLDSDATTASQLDEAVTLCREMAERSAGHAGVRNCLVRLLLRQGDLEGALAGARKLLTLAGAAQTVVELCVLVAQKAQGDAGGELLIPALQLEIEARLKVPDVPTALERLQTLSQHPACTRDRWLWAAECLRAIAAETGFEQRARIVLADVLSRLQFQREAGEQLLAVIDQDLPAELLEQACSALAHVGPQASDPDRARAALAAGWLRLGRPGEARGPLLACVQARRPESGKLLELVHARLAAAPAQIEWAELSLEADLAAGGEQPLLAAATRLQQLLEQNAASAEWIEAAARRLEKLAPSVAVRRAAVLLQAQALATAGQYAKLSALAQSATAQHADGRTEFFRAVERASDQAPRPEKARLCMTLARMLAESGSPEAEKSVRFYAQAAELDPPAWSERVMTETGELASRAGGWPGAILTTLRTALRLGKGGLVCPEVLRSLDRLSDDELREVRELMDAVRKEKPAAPEAWLVRARCATRLADLVGALEAYRRILPLSLESLVEAAAADLRRLHQDHAENADVFLAYIDALLRRGDVVSARSALQDRIAQFPDQADLCLQRLETVHQKHGRSWEDLCAFAEALRMAGKPAQAVPVWRQILDTDGIDWTRCATALQQLCIAMPKDFSAGALLVRAETRSLPPDKLNGPVHRLERLLALPEKDAACLQGLLADCAYIEDKSKGREQMARLLGLRRTEILAGQKNHAAAAAEWDRLLQRWSQEARAAAAFCRRELSADGPPIYLLPLARSRFLAGDFAAGTEALRQLLEALPGNAGPARALGEEFAGVAKGAGWESLQLLRADLAAQDRAFPAAAERYLALATQAPDSAPTVKQRLAALIQGGAEAPEIPLALAELELEGKPEKIPAAFAVLQPLLERDAAGPRAAALDYLRQLKRRFPKVLEARTHLLRVFLRRAEGAFTEIQAEADELFRDFGKDGAAAFVSLCHQELAARKELAPLWLLKCIASERLGDLPGSLECLQTLLRLDPVAQAGAVQQRAGGYLQPDGGPAPVAIFLADLARATGRNPDAIRHYADAVELADADLNHARDGLRAILDAEPGDAAALGALARCEWRAGSPVAAARCYQLAAGRPGPALDGRLKELCETFPDSAKCWFVRAQHCVAKADFAEAFTCLQHACPGSDLEREEQGLAWKMLADCYARQGQFDEAVSILRRVIESEPADNAATRRLIGLYFEKNACRLAQTREAMARAGETPELILECAELLRAQGDYAEAARWFKKVPRDHPLASHALLQLGRCHLTLSQCHLAIVAFKAVLADSPTPEQRRAARYHLGLTHARLLEFESAVSVFEQLCIEDADYRDAAEQLRRCQEQCHAGDVFRVAEVPFDLLSAWRELATGGPRPGALPAASAPPPVPPLSVE